MTRVERMHDASLQDAPMRTQSGRDVQGRRARSGPQDRAGRRPWADVLAFQPHRPHGPKDTEWCSSYPLLSELPLTYIRRVGHHSLGAIDRAIDGVVLDQVHCTRSFAGPLPQRENLRRWHVQAASGRPDNACLREPGHTGMVGAQNLPIASAWS